MYIFDKRSHQAQKIDNIEYVIFDDKEYEDLFTLNYEDISKNYGYIGSNEEGKPVYVDYTNTIMVNRERYYWTEGKLTDDDNFYSVELPVKKIQEMNNKRMTTPSTQVLYYDNDFHVFDIENGYTFDYKKKQVVRDDVAIINNIMWSFNNANIDFDVRYNGFPLVVGGKTYLQPFRGSEDIIYFQTMKNDFSPEQREMRLYKVMENGLRDANSWDTVTGVSITDELLTGIIQKIVKYGSALKGYINDFMVEVNTFKEETNLEKVLEYKENAYKIIMDKMTKEMEG